MSEPLTSDAALEAEPGSTYGLLQSGAGRPADNDLVLAAESLLRSHPYASVVAIAESGLFVPMPASVPLTSHVVIHGHASALELVVPADIVRVVEAWKTTRLRGYARAEVHALDDPGPVTVLHFIDVQQRYGVLLGVAVHPHSVGIGVGGSRGAGGLLKPRVSIVRKNEIAEFTAIDAAATMILGYGRDELVGRPNLGLVHPEDQARAVANWMDMLSVPGGSRRVRLRQRHRDGHWIWFEITNHNLLSDPDERCVVAELIDISEEMAAQETLRANEHLLRRLTESLPVGVLQISGDRSVVHSNARLAAILGNAEATSFDDVFAGVGQAHRQVLYEAVDLTLQRGEDADLEISARRDNGAQIRCRLNLRSLNDEDGRPNGALVCVDDVTDGARLREQLERRATFDALTGCHNRASVLSVLDAALLTAAAEDSGVAVAFVDLDGFKAVNDRRGHAEGDRLLRRVGHSLRHAIRREDTVGRYGGDEFLVLCLGVESVEQAQAFGERLSAGMQADLEPEPPHRAAASVGVAWSGGADGRDDCDAEQLIRRADAAMYISKREGLGQAVLFNARSDG